MKLSRFLIAITLITIFVGCQKDEPALYSDFLFLKSAEAGETTCVEYSESGRPIKYCHPSNVLFLVSGDSTRVLNNAGIKVENFQLLPEDQAVFTISETKSASLLVHARKLPFLNDDYGRQLSEGDARFNGILKIDNYVLAVNMAKREINIFDLDANKLTIVEAATVHNNALFFKIENKIWQIWPSKLSPVGYVFQGLVEGKQFLCYTLYP
jgi:hypothetical protein